MQNCPFCHPQADPDQQIVMETEHCYFLQKSSEQTILAGSGLIVPKQHRRHVFELTRPEWEDTYDLLQQVKQLLDKQYAPQGYNVGWNVEEVGGQFIPHAHLHVVPRFADEPLAGKGIRHFMKQPENKRPSSTVQNPL